MQTIEKFYYDILSEQAQKAPDREAIIMGKTRLTYRQLLDKIDSVAATLLNMGLKKGEKVGLWASASPAWLYTYYGIIRAGGIALILNANLTLKDAEPLVTFAETTYMMFGKTHDIAGHADDAQTIAEAFALDGTKCVSIVDEDFSDAPSMVPDTTGWTVRDDAYIIYTSGTTPHSTRSQTLSDSLPRRFVRSAVKNVCLAYRCSTPTRYLFLGFTFPTVRR